MIVALVSQAINLGLIYTDSTSISIISDFVSLLIITELDDFYFITTKDDEIGQLISRGKIKW